MVNTDSLVASNPNLYHSYVLAGDYSFAHASFEKARDYYKIALTKVIATKPEEDHIHEQLKKVGTGSLELRVREFLNEPDFIGRDEGASATEKYRTPVVYI